MQEPGPSSIAARYVDRTSFPVSRIVQIEQHEKPSTCAAMELIPHTGTSCRAAVAAACHERTVHTVPGVELMVPVPVGL
jgi:hypothetical protein